MFQGGALRPQWISLRNRRLRETVRQVELAQRNLDLHARIGVVAEHFGDAPDRLHVPAPDALPARW